MASLFTAAITAGALVFLCSAWGVWRLTGRFRHAGKRWGGRIAAVPVLIWLGGATTVVALEPRREGTWACLVCAAQRDEFRYFGVTLDIADEASPDTVAVWARRYQEWFQVEPLEHEHTWQPVGGHSVGTGTFADYPYLGEYLYRHAPLLSDQALARALVQRVGSQEPGERYALLCSLDNRTGEFKRASKANVEVADEFAPVYREWLGQ